MLAASLVFPTSPDISPAFGHFAAPTACISQEDQDGRNAKRASSFSSKPDFQAAKEPSRGRSIPLAALKAFEGSDDGEDTLEPPAPPTRENRYVCPSDMVMIGRSYCVDVYEASLMQEMDDRTEQV